MPFIQINPNTCVAFGGFRSSTRSTNQSWTVQDLSKEEQYISLSQGKIYMMRAICYQLKREYDSSLLTLNVSNP